MNVGAADSGCIPADADGCVHQGSIKGEGEREREKERERDSKERQTERKEGRKEGRKEAGREQTMVTMLTALFSLG